MSERERERELEGERDRQTDRQTDRLTDRERERESFIERRWRYERVAKEDEQVANTNEYHKQQREREIIMLLYQRSQVPRRGKKKAERGDIYRRRKGICLQLGVYQAEGLTH
jgi:hypothetical protein